MKASVIKQYSIFMPNKPGALSKLCRLFSDKDISILGLASEVRDDSGIVRLAIDSEDDVSWVLTEAGFGVVITPLLSVEVDDHPGVITMVSELFQKNGINITTIYGTAVAGNQSHASGEAGALMVHGAGEGPKGRTQVHLGGYRDCAVASRTS